MDQVVSRVETAMEVPAVLPLASDLTLVDRPKAALDVSERDAPGDLVRAAVHRAGVVDSAPLGEAIRWPTPCSASTLAISGSPIFGFYGT